MMGAARARASSFSNCSDTSVEATEALAAPGQSLDGVAGLLCFSLIGSRQLFASRREDLASGLPPGQIKAEELEGLGLPDPGEERRLAIAEAGREQAQLVTKMVREHRASLSLAL